MTFELWSEFPSFMVEIIPDEPAMNDYKETLYAFGDQEDGIIIPGWNLKKLITKIILMLRMMATIYRFYALFNR